MYVAWQNVDPTFSFIGVFMTMSKDGGDTWSDDLQMTANAYQQNHAGEADAHAAAYLPTP